MTVLRLFATVLAAGLATAATGFGATLTNLTTFSNANISAVKLDSQGFVYVCGTTSESGVQASPGLNYGPSGPGHVFLQKLTPGSLQVVYTAVVGGSGSDSGTSLAVDSAGAAYVTGKTGSPDFPNTAGSRPSTSANGSSIVDTFVFKLAMNGTLVFSRVIGGNGSSIAASIAVGSAGIYIAGSTNAADFPTTMNAIQTVPGGDGDAFVLQLTNDGSNIQYATYLGGPGPDFATSIGVDPNGGIYVSGQAGSYFPTLATSLAPQQIEGGFVAKINASTGQFIFSTYLPGVSEPANLQVDSNGNVYLTGLAGTGFPATSGAFSTDILEGGFGVLFLMELNPDGGIVFATLVAGGADGSPQIALFGNEVVLASTSSSNVFPANDFSTPSCELAAIVNADEDLFTTSFATFSTSGTFLSGWTYGFCEEESVVALTAGASGTFLIYGSEFGSAVLVQFDLNSSAKVQVAHVVDSAGYSLGPIIPGQLISIFGSGLGPEKGVSVPFNGVTYPVSFAGTQATICARPAPLLYVSQSVINAIVPTNFEPGYCEISVSTPAGASATYTTYSWYESPSIFTKNGMGFGQAAAVNQDGTINSPSNPAPRGSVVTVFGTGAGLTNPEFPDGAVATQAAEPPYPNSFAADVGFNVATIQYVGAAPSLVNGVMQINVTIPNNTTPGPSVPIALAAISNEITLFSQPNVTIAVK